MEKNKEHYQAPDMEELEGSLFLVEAEASPKEQITEGDVAETDTPD